MLELGDTFLLPHDINKVEHLWVAITEPDEMGKAVCVNVSSSSSSFCDETVVLQPSDHPFISKKSVIRYMDAAVLDLKEVGRAMKGFFSFTCVKKQKCERELLKKIQKGLLESQHTSKHIQDRFRHQTKEEE